MGGVATALAQSTIVPNQGQTTGQVTADQTACQSQATASTGYTTR